MPILYSSHADILLSAMSVSLLFAGVICLCISRETTLSRPLPSWRYLGVALIIMGLREWLGLIGLYNKGFASLYTYTALTQAAAALTLLLAARIEAASDGALIKTVHVTAAFILALVVGVAAEPFVFTGQPQANQALASASLYYIVKAFYAIACLLLLCTSWKSPRPPNRATMAILCLVLVQSLVMAGGRPIGLPGFHGVHDPGRDGFFLTLYGLNLALGFLVASLAWNKYAVGIGVRGQIRWWPLILIFFCLAVAFMFIFIATLDMRVFRRLAVLTLPQVFVFFLLMISGQQRAWLSSHSLSRTEALRQGALGNELTGVMITRGEVIVNVNQRCCDLVGISSGQLVGRNVGAIFHIDGRPVADEVREAIDQKGNHLFELALNLPDNRQVHLMVFARKLTDDRDDRHYLWECVDITRHKEMERKIRENRDYLQMIIDTVPVGVFVRDADDTYQLANRAFVELLGYYRMEDVIGKTPFEVRPMDLGVFQRNEAICVNMDGGTLVYEQPFTIDGEERLYEISKTVKWWGKDREAFLMVGSMHDFTPRTKTREALAAATHFFQQLIDTLPIAVCFQDRNGIIRLYNEKFRRETGGGEPGELVGKAYAEAVKKGPNDPEDDKAMLMRGGSADETFELAVDGKTRTLVMRRTVMISREGEILGLVKTFWQRPEGQRD